MLNTVAEPSSKLMQIIGLSWAPVPENLQDRLNKASNNASSLKGAMYAGLNSIEITAFRILDIGVTIVTGNSDILMHLVT